MDLADAAEVWETIERERCTVALGVPTIWKMLRDAPQFATVDLSHVRWFISGGAPLPAFLIDAYQQRGVTLKQGYGLTEVGVNCFTMTIEDARAKYQAVLASGGIYHDPTVILKVVDSEGRVLQEWKPNPGVRVLPAQVAYEISDILRPVGAAPLSGHEPDGSVLLPGS